MGAGEHGDVIQIRQALFKSGRSRKNADITAYWKLGKPITGIADLLPVDAVLRRRACFTLMHQRDFVPGAGPATFLIATPGTIVAPR